MSFLLDFIHGFKDGQKKFSETIGTIINSILLGVVYLIGVGITSLAAKLFKKEFLEMKISKEDTTYWSDLNLRKKNIEEYNRQF